MIALLLMKGAGGSLHDRLRLPRLLTTNIRQLEILVTTLQWIKKALSMSINVFSANELIGALFLRLQLETGHQFTWSSEPRKGQAACSAKRVTSFLSYFQTLTIGPALGMGIKYLKRLVTGSHDGFFGPVQIQFYS